MVDELLNAHRPLLGTLASTETVALESPFWLELLSFPAALSAFEPDKLQEGLRPYCHQLAVNTQRTHHLSVLLWHVSEQLRLASPSKGTQAGLQQACNCVLFFSVVLREVSAVRTGEELQALCQPSTSQGLGSRDLLSQLVQACLAFVQDTLVTQRSYVLYLSVLQLLIALCSSQLYAPTSDPPGPQPALEVIHAQKRDAAKTVQRLLMLYVQRPALATTMPLWLPPVSRESASVMSSIADAATSIVLLPFRAAAKLFPVSGMFDSRSPIRDCALGLLLLLLHYAPPPQLVPSANVYKRALQDMRNADSTQTMEDAEAGVASTSASASVPFSKLFDEICENLDACDDATVLLLYNLLNRCNLFLEAVLVRSDIDALLIPLIKALYGASAQMPHQLYMLQIIILILSQDATLGKKLHKVNVPRVAWYRERTLANTSLGSLCIIVLLRVAHHNLHGSQDLYLHTNTLAVLANFAPHVSKLDAHAAQRLLQLMDALYKRRQRAQRTAAAPADPGTSPSQARAPEQDAQLVDDFLRTIIEITDTMVAHALQRNPELVYALLHRQDMLQRLAAEPGWGPIFENILAVIAHFNSVIDGRTPGASGGPTSAWSVSSVMEVIEAQLRLWRGSQVKAVAELKFTYEEAAGSEEFFLPYVWSLVTVSPWMSFPMQGTSRIAPAVMAASLQAE